MVLRQIYIGFFAGIVCIVAAAALRAEEQNAVAWDDCVRDMQLYNPELVSAREAVKESEASIGVTRSAILPQINATAGAQKESTASSRSPSGGSVNSYSYGITGKQLLFDGFKSIYDIDGAKSRVESVKLDFAVRAAAVTQNLRNAYIDLLKAQEMLKVTKEIAVIRKHDLDLVKLRYDAGSDHRGSYFQAKADYSQAKASLQSTERDLVLAQKGLYAAIGRVTVPGIIVKGEMDLAGQYATRPDMNSLAGMNPAYKKSAMLKESAMYSVKSAKMSYSPQLYGVVGAERTGTTMPPNANSWSVGVQMTAPLFSGGQTYYGVKQSDAKYRQASADEESAKISVLKTLEEAWDLLMNSIDAVAVQKEYLTAAEERARIANQQYSIGTITYDSWSIIENSLVSAKQNYITALSAMMRAEAQWVQSTGGVVGYEKRN